MVLKQRNNCCQSKEIFFFYMDRRDPLFKLRIRFFFFILVSVTIWEAKRKKMTFTRRVHRGTYLQHGRGFGSIISGIIRVLKPIFTSGAKMALSTGKKALGNAAVQSAINEASSAAVKGGMNLAGNLIGGNEKTPALLKKDVKQARKRIGNALKGLEGAKKKRRKKEKTIFDD